MDKLFQAIRDQHPDYEVLDVKLLANQHQVADQNATEIDEEFAVAINNACGPIPLSELT